MDYKSLEQIMVKINEKLINQGVILRCISWSSDNTTGSAITLPINIKTGMDFSGMSEEIANQVNAMGMSAREVFDEELGCYVVEIEMKK